MMFSFPKQLNSLRFYLFTVVLVLLGASSAGAFPWPDPQQYKRVILYANQEILEYMEKQPEWFNHDFLIAGVRVTGVVYGDGNRYISAYTFIKDKLMRDGFILGTYISGTTAMHERDLDNFPAQAASIEDMSVKTRFLWPWIRNQKQLVVDLRDPTSMQQLQQSIQLTWAHTPAQIRFIEDAAIHPRVAKIFPWELYCSHMARLRDIAYSLGANVIFSVLARPWELTEEETKQLIDAVGTGNAIAFPLPWSKSIKENENALGWAAYRYRQILKSGIAVIIIPSGDAPYLELRKWLSKWSAPSDRIYYGTSASVEPPL